jgi:hypothetical protein
VAQQGRDTLAELQSSVTDDDHLSIRVAGHPIVDVLMPSAVRARDQPWVESEVLVNAHVYDRRRAGKAYQAGQLRNGDFGWRRHGTPSLRSRVKDAMLGLTPHGVIANPMALG